ncbi:penicillin-insensitive murein endopeptidase [Caldichromatium japonicum]|uniref:Penicillin-insensitive murein endopeptidase n=1 Tax=Caldichromatium japonicum TaxID=2699430 RepID=A0A6G7VH21_9GAMM|nr:penicillin-insensitive murein endopeptidase [Caldichromatium japonicum]
MIQLGALLGLLLPAALVLANPWASVSAPSSGMTQVVGSTASGCIAGADPLSASGPGYVSVRRYRNRYWGHPELIRFIQDLGHAQMKRTGRLVLIGDLSQPRGGPMPSSHRSHQNGLDVDIWLTLADSPEAARRLMDNNPDPPSMVAVGGRSVSAAWGRDQFALIEIAARHPLVDRIFVNAAIKQELCRIAGSDRAWLRKVRPWWGHDAHFHVRLRCPADSPGCDPQKPLPEGDGCGSDLAWWLSDEVLRGLAKAKPPAKRPEPELPPACRTLLHDPPRIAGE